MRTRSMTGQHWKYLAKKLDIEVRYFTNREWKLCKHVDDENARKCLHRSRNGEASNVKRCGMKIVIGNHKSMVGKSYYTNAKGVYFHGDGID